MLLGEPGVGKTRAVRAVFRQPESVCWIESNASAFGIYSLLYQYRDMPVVVDDVDSLYTDRAAVRLLKCLCQTEPIKTVAWNTMAVKQNHLPQSFVTTSRTALIVNEWKTLNRNVAAIEDRGHVLRFDPPFSEVHNQTCRWFRDGEILQFVASVAHLIHQPSMRLYILSLERKKAGLDWRELLIAELTDNPTIRAVARLKNDRKFATEEARAKAFVGEGYGCRATYFNHARRLSPAPVENG